MRLCLWRVSHPPPCSRGGSKHRACKPKFPLSGDAFSTLLVFYTAHGAELCDVAAWGFQSAVSKTAEYLHPSPAPQCLWVPRLSPLTAPHLQGGLRDPSCHRERQKMLQVPPCPRARLEGAGNGVPGKLLSDGDREGQELRGSRKNKMCTCGRAGGALCPSLCVSYGTEVELRWVFLPGNAARGKRE